MTRPSEVTRTDPIERLTRDVGSIATDSINHIVACLPHLPVGRMRRSDPRRRGSGHQHPQRTREQITRRRVAARGTHLVRRGRRWREIAQLFGVADRTLRRWCRDPAIAAIKLLGRPLKRSSRVARNEVVDFLDTHGPQVSVSTLRECFPTMSRAELTDLLKRYRRVWRKRHRVPLRVLRWLVPGRVWAIDFTGPMRGIEGGARYVLAVRDLASGRQLLWQPVEAPTGEVAREALASLFARHGAPVVLKCDNGSAFISGVVREWLAEHGVVSLYSPPHWPRYNGAIEAGIGSLKVRTEARATRAGHAGIWTWDDLAGAQAEANTLSRPWGERGTSPEAVWLAREPITPVERAVFAAAVTRAQETHERELEADGAEG